MSYLDQPAILQKANEILANNSRYLSTASVTPLHHAGAWPGHPYGGYEDGSAYRRQRSATCSPTRRGRPMSHVSSEDYHEVMAQASKYRPKSYLVKAAPPLPPGLTTAQHRPSYTGSNHSLYGASPVPTVAPGFLGYGADYNTRGHTTSADALNTDTFYQNQMKKLLRDIQQHASDLQHERQEGEKLRHELRDRDAAVHDARSVARTAKQQLEEELAKRRDVDARLSDAQRDCETAHKARIVSEKQLSDVRSLAVSLEEQNRKLRNQASQKEAVSSHEAERELQQSRQHIDSLMAKIQSLQDSLEARGVALADAERAANNSSKEAAVLRAQLAVSNSARLTASDSEGALEADIARLCTLQEQRESKSRPGDRWEHPSKQPPVEIMQLRCAVEEKDRDLATMKERISTLQGELDRARTTAAEESAIASGATEKRAIMQLQAEKQSLQQQAADAEGAYTLLQAQCTALRQDLARAQKELDATASGRNHEGDMETISLRNATPAVERDMMEKALPDGSGPVAGTLSIGSVQSWRIEAGGPASSAAEEGVRLRAALEEARALYAELELSSGEQIHALQQQVRELQQQVSDQLQESKLSGREAQLQSVIEQLQAQLLHVRDIHGVSMPLLDSDEGLLADVPELSQTGNDAQAAATKALQSEVPQKLEWLQGKLQEAENRSADFKRAQQAAAEAAQSEISNLRAQVESLTQELASSRKQAEGQAQAASSNCDELDALYSTIEVLRHEQDGLTDQLKQAQTQYVTAQKASDANLQDLEAAKLAVCQAREQAGQHMEELADVRMKLATKEHAVATAHAAAAAARQDAEAAQVEVSGLQMEVEGLRGQLEEAERRYATAVCESSKGQAAIEREAADAASEAEFLQKEVETLKQKLLASEQNANSSAASAAAAASGDLEGLQGQNAALREEVMDLRLRLEGTSSAAEEVAHLRQREQQLQQDLQHAQETLSHRQAQAGDSTWVWSQVHDLTAQVTTLREQLAQSQTSAQDLKGQLSAAQAEAAAARQSGDAETHQQLQAEATGLRQDLEAAERARDKLDGRVLSLQAQIGELQTAVANEQRRQQEGARAAEESHARERTLEEELANVRRDLVEAQRSLVAAVQSPEELAVAVSDVAERALDALRSGIADAFPASHGITQAASASDDEWLLQEVAAAISKMQPHSGGGESEHDEIAALKYDLQISEGRRKRAEDASLEAEIEITRISEEVENETEARQKAEASCEELLKKLHSATTDADDLRSKLKLCREELASVRNARAVEPSNKEPATPQPRGITIPALNPAAIGSPEEARALRKALQDATTRAETLEQDLARLEMEMPDVQRQRDEAYAAVTNLEEQLKDLRDKGYKAARRISAAEDAAARSKAEAEEAISSREKAAAELQDVREVIGRHVQRIQDLEQELSQRPSDKPRAHLPVPPSQRGLPKLATPQPRSVVRSDTCTPRIGTALAHDPEAESLRTLAAADQGPAAVRCEDRSLIDQGTVPPACGIQPHRTTFGRYGTCDDVCSSSCHHDEPMADAAPTAMCNSVVNVTEETTLADVGKFTPALPTDHQAQNTIQSCTHDDTDGVPSRDDSLAHLMPPGPLSSDTSESRPPSTSHNGTGAVHLQDIDTAAIRAPPLPHPSTSATLQQVVSPLAHPPFPDEASPLSAAVSGRVAAATQSGGSNLDPGNLDQQGSVVSDGPPRAQGAISPILEHEVMEFADVPTMRRQGPKHTKGDLTMSMGESCDVAMGSLASFVDFGRMGSMSPAGDNSAEAPDSAQLLCETSDAPDTMLSPADL